MEKNSQSRVKFSSWKLLSFPDSVRELRVSHGVFRRPIDLQSNFISTAPRSAIELPEISIQHSSGNSSSRVPNSSDKAFETPANLPFQTKKKPRIENHSEPDSGEEAAQLETDSGSEFDENKVDLGVPMNTQDLEDGEVTIRPKSASVGGVSSNSRKFSPHSDEMRHRRSCQKTPIVKGDEKDEAESDQEEAVEPKGDEDSKP